MFKKRIAYLLAVIIVSTAFLGCNLISGAFDSIFLDAPDVAASDLASYSTSTTEADSESDVAKGFELAMKAIAAQAPASRILGDDYDDIAAILRYSSPEMNALLGDTTASRSMTASASAVINNEETTFEGIDVTIEKLDVSGNMSIDSLSSTRETKVDFKAMVNIGFEDISESVTDTSVYPSQTYLVTIDDMKFNLNSNGNATTTFTSSGSLDSINYYLGCDFGLGFSLSCNGFSGKYVVNAKYVNSADWQNGDESITGSQTLNIDVTAYNNSNTVIDTKTYSAEEFFAVIVASVPAS